MSFAGLPCALTIASEPALPVPYAPLWVSALSRSTPPPRFGASRHTRLSKRLFDAARARVDSRQMARFGLVLTVAALLAALLASGSPAQAQAAVPAAPTGLTAPTVAHDSVTLSWDDPGDSSITGHRVLRRFRDGDVYEDGLGAAEFVAIIDDTGSSATTYTDTSVAPRTRYVYRVKAINSAGTSGQSNYVNVETPDAPTSPSPPAAPTGLAVQSATHDSITLTWDDPGDSSITGHQVLRRFRDGDVYEDGLGATEFVPIIDDTGSSATTYTDTSVAPRTRYVYRGKGHQPCGNERAVQLRKRRDARRAYTAVGSHRPDRSYSLPP